MPAGDFHIRRNSSLTTAIPNAGSNVDSDWDVVEKEVGSIVTYTNPNFQLDIGLYLVMYSEKFTTTDTTNNERIEIQGEIHVSGTGVVGGYSQDYIRKSSGQQDCNLSGYMILDVTSDNTDVFIRFYRTDNSTTGTVNRVVDFGSVIILELDDTDNYGLYSTSSSEATSGSTERTLNIDTNDRQDTGFTRTGSAVDVANTGRYLVTYSIDISTTGTGREDVVGRLTNAGTEIVGSNSFCYIRGGDGCQDGALTWIGIIDLAGGEDLDVRWQAPQSATMTAAAGATLQIWQIPSGADEAIMEATTGDYNADADFTWDTLPHIDTGSFTATAGNSNIDIDQADYCLTFATFHQDAPDSPQRAYPELAVNVDGSLSKTATGGVYHRNNGGAGIVAVTIADLVQTDTNSSIEIHTTPTGASGTLTNDSAQFAILSLESLFGPYTFPPSITDVEDEQLGPTETGVILDGFRFEAVQGTGKLELASSADYGTATKVTQIINSWSDTQIDFDVTLGALSEGSLYLFVTNDTGDRSSGYLVAVGLLPYHVIIANQSPDHWWTFDNTYNDEISTNNFTTVINGGGALVATPICEQNTHSWHADALGDRRECPNSTNMNDGTTTNRLMGGWIRVDGVSKTLSCVYEEGGGVNNLAFFIGMGNVLVAQLADTGDDNVQAYSNIKLTPNRPYHIMFRFSYTDVTKEFLLYLDGVEQGITDGNPLTSTNLDSHTGDISIGGPGGSLEMGGTDVTFTTQEDTYYANWVTWSASKPEADIVELFERGALPSITITTDTEANMQIDLDTYADTERPDAPLAIRVEDITGGGDLELTADDITFNTRVSLQLEWRGSGTLTWRNSGTSDLVLSKTIATNGGTIVIQETAQIQITVLDVDDSTPIENARVYIEADTGGPLTAGVVIFNGLANASGIISTEIDYDSDQPITGRVRKGSSSTYYKTSQITGTVTSNGLVLTIFLIKD